MAVNITVQLSDEQVSQALVYARKVKPDASNAELIAELEDAAYWGPGIRDVIAGWEYTYTRQAENEARAVSRADFLEEFPEKPADPEPDPEQVSVPAEAKTNTGSTRKPRKTKDK